MIGPAVRRRSKCPPNVAGPAKLLTFLPRPLDGPVFYLDQAIAQFWKRLASIIAVNGGDVEYCVEFNMTAATK